MGGGGAERQLAYLVNTLIKRGLEVHVALVHDGPNMKRLIQSGAYIHKIRSRSNYSPNIAWQLRKVINKIRPDLIQVWLYQMEIIGGVTALSFNLPWIFSERSSALAYKPFVMRKIRKIVASKADAIISNSRSGELYWQRQLGNDVKRYVIPNAVPFEEIEAVGESAPQIPDQYSGSKLLLYVGRFDEGKNLKTLVIALQQVLVAFDVFAVFCGEGVAREDIKQMAKKHGLADRISLPGYVPEVWALMKRASIFISLSLFEGQPNTVLEAIVCGCPLVVSDIPEHREFLDEKAALLINPRDPQAISEAIINVLSSPGDALRRAQNARLRVEHRSMSAIAQQYEQVYLKVLEKSKTRGAQ